MDLLIKVINRFDFYTNSTNAKTSLIIAWNSFIFGAILLKYNDILIIFPLTGWAHYLSVSLILLAGICSLVSNVFAFWVVFPFLQSSNTHQNSSSMFFFGSVSSMSAQEYLIKVTNANFEAILTDLSDQVVTMARGLNIKMARLQNSIWTIYGGLITAGCLLVLKAIVSF